MIQHELDLAKPLADEVLSAAMRSQAEGRAAIYLARHQAADDGSHAADFGA